MKLFAPAKLNLFLNVRSKRADGFHEIETLFERIKLFDEITLLPARSGIRIETASKKIPRGPTNIAYRAAKLLKDERNISTGVIIRIGKHIPVEAGLGGGSSDAATVLLGLNRLWNLRLSKKKLMQLGARLGSDVPFFILQTPLALGRGRGETLKPIRLKITKHWFVIVKPPFGISTKEAYSQIDRAAKGSNAPNRGKLTPLRSNVKMLLHSIHEGSSERLSKLLINSLELTGNKQVKIIFSIKDELIRHGALGSLMSGSGSAVFGIYLSKKRADRAARHLSLSHKEWEVFVVSNY